MDNVIKSDVHYQEHTGVITHVTSQPTEGLILDRNKELRKNPGVIRDLSDNGETWGRQLASIPFVTYEKAIRDGFDLSNTDKQIAGLEMARYLKTPEGQDCLVQ